MENGDLNSETASQRMVRWEVGGFGKVRHREGAVLSARVTMTELTAGFARMGVWEPAV